MVSKALTQALSGDLSSLGYQDKELRASEGVGGGWEHGETLEGESREGRPQEGSCTRLLSSPALCPVTSPLGRLRLQEPTVGLAPRNKEEGTEERWGLVPC